MVIVKIIKKAQDFQGVQYNTNKVELDRGELMLVRNFEALQGMGPLRPRDYVNYFKAVTNRNQLIKSPQFHAVISCKEKEKNKQELTELAEKWLERMGYGQTPYMLIFHKDTKHNHIHMVSSRVDKQAKLIDFGFTHIRAIKILNELTGIQEQLMAENDLKLAMSYQFSSREQFELILRTLGYSSALKGTQINLYKFGRKLTDVAETAVKKRILASVKDEARALAIRRIIEEHKKTWDPLVYKKRNFYLSVPRSKLFTSALTEELRERYGLQFFFHARPGLSPHSFTIVDHSSARVFADAEIMPLRALIAPAKAPGVFVRESSDEAAWPTFQLSITDDVDDEAVFGRHRNGRRKNPSQEITR